MHCGIFAITPQLLSRVKLRGIAGQPFNLDMLRVFLEIATKQFRMMYRPIIKNNNKIAADMLPKGTNKGTHTIAVDVVAEDSEVHPQMLASGRYGESANSRQTIALIALVQY